DFDKGSHGNCQRVLFAALTHTMFFTVELLQENFRERWRWGIAQLGFGGTAIRECDVNNSGGNSVSATDDTAVFGGTANVDLCGLIDLFFGPTTMNPNTSCFSDPKQTCLSQHITYRCPL